jgi:hypothetical protein
VAAASSDLERTFERDGFLVLKKALTAQHTLSLRQFLLAALARHETRPDPNSPIQSYATPCRAIWPDFFETNPDWFDILCNARVVDALHALLGDPFVLTRDSIAHWGYFPDWHTDTTTSETAGKSSHRHPDWRMLTIGVYLQSGAGLSVVPGSHHAPDPFVAMRKQRTPPSPWHCPDAIELATEAGDAVIFDMRLIHRASKLASATSACASEKLALFWRASRNIPAHIAEYSDFQYNGAGRSELNLSQLRAHALARGFLIA